MTRDGAAAARVAHNHEVPGSSPGPATKQTVSPSGGTFFFAEATTRFWDSTARWRIVPGTFAKRAEGRPWSRNQ